MSDKEYDSGITEIPDENPQKDRRKPRKKSFTGNKRNSGGFSAVQGAIAIAVILIVIFVAFDLGSGGVLSSVNGRIVSVLTRSSTESFSADINADEVYDFRSFGRGYVILTNNGVSYVNSSGRESASQQLSYSSPSMEIGGKRALIYDRGGTGYTLERGNSLYSQQEAENSIIDAAISSRNNYAIAVRDEKANTILYGFDERGKVIYQWNCPDGYISDIAITSSGGKVAATVINSENAVLSSRVYILDFEYNSAYAEFDYTDEIVIGAKFLSQSKVLVVTDKKVCLISGKEQTTLYEYGSADIICSDIGSGKYSAVVTQDYSSDDSYLLTVFSGDKLKYTVQLSGRIRAVSISDKSTAVLFDDKTETYSKRGKLLSSVRDINRYGDIVVNGNYLYVLSTDCVKRLPAYGTVNETAAEEGTD